VQGLPQQTQQTPFVQFWGKLQTLPQLPQLLLSWLSRTQVPLQLVPRGPQLQTPELHDPPVGQRLPQAPQL
jgi:hypothetical protein